MVILELKEYMCYANKDKRNNLFDFVTFVLLLHMSTPIINNRIFWMVIYDIRSDGDL